MSIFKLAVVGIVLGCLGASVSQAQVVVYRPIVPGPQVIVTPTSYAPIPVVTTYSSYYRAPAVSYVAPAVSVPAVRVYRPYVPVAPVRVPAVVSTVRVRRAVIGRGIGPFPNVYRRGQPVRNAVRFAIP